MEVIDIVKEEMPEVNEHIEFEAYWNYHEVKQEGNVLKTEEKQTLEVHDDEDKIAVVEEEKTLFPDNMDSPENLTGLHSFCGFEGFEQTQRDRKGKRCCTCDGDSCYGKSRGSRKRSLERTLRRVMGEGDAAQLAALLLTGCWPDPLLQRALKSVSCEDMARAFASTAPGFFWERGGGQSALLCAASEGRAKAVRALLAAGVAADRKVSWTNQQALSAACSKGHTDCVKALLEYGADPRQVLQNHVTLLHLAAESGVVGSVEALLQRGVDVRAMDERGSTPLHRAADKGDALCVRALLQAGAEPNARDHEGNSPLHVASMNYYWSKPTNGGECVRELARGGADVNALNADCCSPLLLAVQNDNLEISRVLIDCGADLHERTKQGGTLVHTASSSRITAECLTEFLSRPECPSIESRDNEGNTPLLSAAKCGNADAVKVLLRAGADTSVRDHEGYTPLHRAATQGVAALVHDLVHAGADVTAIVTEDQLTPLHLAAIARNSSMVVALLENGADINDRTVNWKTALHFSVHPWTHECLEELLIRGADIQATDDDGCTALHYAAQIGSFDNVQFLVQRGLSLMDRKIDGQTALHLAAGTLQEECVTAMLRKLRAPVNARDHVGRTALHVAARATDEGTVRVLLLAGADRLARDDFGDVAADVTENEDIRRLIRRWALAA